MTRRVATVVVAGVAVLLTSTYMGTAAAQVVPGLIVSPNPVAVGAVITVKAEGFAPAALVAINLVDAQGRVTRLARTPAGDGGALAAHVTIPRSTAAGEYTLQVVGVTPEGSDQTLAAPLNVSGKLVHTGSDMWATSLAGMSAVALGMVLVYGALQLRHRALLASVAARPRFLVVRTHDTRGVKPTTRIRIRLRNDKKEEDRWAVR